MFAEDEASILLAAASSVLELDVMVRRRVGGVPLEQVVGFALFRGMRIVVEPGVFVPRRRTEFLVAHAVALAPAEAVVVDLCCGTGALGVALAASVDVAELHASDIEPAAVRCARRNVESVGGHVHQGDLFAPLPTALQGRVDVLLCNVPYVPTADIAFLPAEARDHEPAVTLDGGPDGLDVLRRAVAEAPRWLADGGVVLMEVSERQERLAVLAVTGAGLTASVVTDDELGATVVIGRR